MVGHNKCFMQQIRKKTNHTWVTNNPSSCLLIAFTMQRLVIITGRLHVLDRVNLAVSCHQVTGHSPAVSVHQCRAMASGQPQASKALLDNLKDKDLLKTSGFVGGQWVSASDGSTFDVSCCF